MKQFNYTITDEIGLHARPAGLLVKETKNYQSAITLTCGDKTVKAGSLIAIMSLGVKCGQTVTISADGADEDAAYEGMKAFFEANL